jgi:hypothetical protein
LPIALFLAWLALVGGVGVIKRSDENNRVRQAMSPVGEIEAMTLAESTVKKRI